MFATDLDSEIDDDGLSVGAIVGIVIVVLLVLVAIVGAVFYVFVSRQRADRNGAVGSSNTIGVQNEAYGSPEYGRKNSDPWGDSGSLRPAYAESSPTGAYVCDQCGKKYDFPEDLSQHVQLRH